MKRITFPIVALGLLISLGPAFAEDETWRDAKTIASVAAKATAYYSGASDAWDTANKLAEMLGWVPAPLTLDGAFKTLDKHITDVYIGLDYKLTMNTISDARVQADAAFNHLRGGGPDYLPTDIDDDNSSQAADRLSIPESGVTVFSRPYDKKRDGDLMALLNNVYTKADLYPNAKGDFVYDWSVGLPQLMLFVSYRVQIIAAMCDGFPLGKDVTKDSTWNARCGVVRDELTGYRTVLQGHYKRMLTGIKCGPYSSVCADIYSRYQVPAGNKLWGYAVHAALPLYELKAMIDTLYLYTHAPTADLTQNYHRLPWSSDLSRCLAVKKGEFGPSLVFMGWCDGSSSQQWVYDRKSGTVRNSGSVANPASGYCLGVTGDIVYVHGTNLQVNVSNCSGSKRQQWTYDPESRVLLNAMGTALEIEQTDYSVWTAPRWRYDPPNYLWQADQIILGMSHFSDTMAPGEKMYKGQSRVSNNNRYELVLQTDGNLVLYSKVTDPPPALPVERAVALWASNTNGRAVSHVVMQSGGNLVIYPPAIPCPPRQRCDPFALPRAIWASNSNGRPRSNLIVQDDGNVVIYQQTTPIWATPRSPRRSPTSPTTMASAACPRTPSPAARSRARSSPSTPSTSQ
jgi:ricin-type beta-trefoil lectin protein